jgi:hypothetical protein
MLEKISPQTLQFTSHLSTLDPNKENCVLLWSTHIFAMFSLQLPDLSVFLYSFICDTNLLLCLIVSPPIPARAKRLFYSPQRQDRPWGSPRPLDRG